MKKYIIIFLFTGILSSCNFFEDLDVENANNPGRTELFSDPGSYFGLISGSYKSWFNHSVGPNPQFGMVPAGETIGSGYGSWKATAYYQVPRIQIENGDDDNVLYAPAATWYGFYKGIPVTNNIIKFITEENQKIVLGEDDYTNNILAHAYLARGLGYGHLAMLMDKAFIAGPEDDDAAAYEYTFSDYKAVRDFAIQSIDAAIAICEANTFADPIDVIPGNTFTNESLGKLANSMAARLLVANSRTATENTAAEWAKVLAYTNKGIDEDFFVGYDVGWQGEVIVRDKFSYHALAEWEWIRVHQRILNMMSPDDSNAAYPLSEANLDEVDEDGNRFMGEITDKPDARFDKLFKYKGPAWTGANYAFKKGFHIMTEYVYIGNFPENNDDGKGLKEDVGFIRFFKKAENDLLKAEALIRTGGSAADAATLINNTRVTKGALPAALAGDADLMTKLFYERFVENLMSLPLLGYTDRRRTDITGFQLRPGTIRHLPVPASELKFHGLDVYSYGGVGNEGI